MHAQTEDAVAGDFTFQFEHLAARSVDPVLPSCGGGHCGGCDGCSGCSH